MPSDANKNTPDLTTRKLKRARSLIGDGKTVAGIRLYEEIIKFDPQDGYAWLEYADSLTDILRFDDAFDAYEQALKFAPDSKKCFVFARIGILLEQSKGVIDAEKYYKLAIDSLSEPTAWVQILYGKNLLVQGRFDEAEKVLAQAADLESREQAEAYLNLAILYRSTTRYSQAREAATQSLAADPTCIDCRALLKSLE